MAYDEGLAERISGVLDEREGVAEKRMFGGIAFMVRGHMCVGIVKDQLMVRVGPEGLDRDADLERWVEHGLRYAASLPAKAVPAKRRTKAKPRGKRR
jgi:hypothetical protein